jgi:Family of unknown function (DUF5317)
VGLLVVVLLVALVVGRWLGGRLDRLAGLPFRSLRLLLSAAVVQLGGFLVSNVLPVAWPVALAVSAVFIGVFLARNYHIMGVPLAASAMMLNALVVVVNGAMPVSLHAATRAGIPAEQLDVDQNPRKEAATGDTLLPWLGRVVPVALPVHREVATPGDLLLAAGLGLLVVSGMRRRDPPDPSFANNNAMDDPMGVWGGQILSEPRKRPNTLDSDSTTLGSYS